MRYYKTLKMVYEAHPYKIKMRDRLSEHLRVSSQSVYRILTNGSAIGRIGVIGILSKEFAIGFDFKKGYYIDWHEIDKIENGGNSTNTFIEDDQPNKVQFGTKRFKLNL
jgi:hypothetical protein